MDNSELPIIIAYGIDYARFLVENRNGMQWFGERFDYLEIREAWYHGSLCVDLAGGALEVIRTVERVDLAIEECAKLFQLKRLDIFADLSGINVANVVKPGTVIINDGCVETIYSHRLNQRSRHVFSRLYDAFKAGHYETKGIWRVETELKREKARAVLNKNGWQVNPIRVLMHYAMLHFGLNLKIGELDACDVNAPSRRIESSRERFYRRYGKNILLDLESMGSDVFHTYIRECMLEKEKENDSKTGKFEVYRASNMGK